MDLYVDQVRGFLTNMSGPMSWTVRQGKKLLSTEKRVNRGQLSLYVGRNRFVPVEAVFLAFADIASGKKLRNWANIPGVFNLFAVEGDLFPERELPIWVTAARMLELASDEDLHSALPPLHTEFDLLHQELPAEAEPEYRLRPSESINHESWSAYRSRLLVQVLPDLAEEVGTTDCEEQLIRLFRENASRLHQYVRSQLFARVANAIAAANGSYALLHVPEESETR